MAKLSDKEKKMLIADYKTNRYSQRELSKKYGVSVGTVNKMTKNITTENEHLVNAQIAIYAAQTILPIEQMNAIMNAAKDEVYSMGLAINATQLNLMRINEALTSNKKLEKISVGQGMQQFEEVSLDSSDYKNMQDAIDKATVTLGINQRHASSQVTVNTQNNNTQHVELTEEAVKKVIADFDDNY